MYLEYYCTFPESNALQSKEVSLKSKESKSKIVHCNCNSLQVKVLLIVKKYCNEVYVLRYNPALLAKQWNDC